MRYVVSLFFVLVASAAHAGTVTVDFEGFDVDGERQMLPGLVADGFQFYDPRSAHGELHLVDDGGCFVGCSASGSQSLLYEGIHPEQPGMILRHPQGLAFRLLSLDVAEAFENSPWHNATSIMLRGHLAGGGIIETAIELDGVIDGADTGTRMKCP